MHARNKEAMWCLGSAIGLIVSTVLFSRRSKRETSLGVMTNARLEKDTSAPGRTEPKEMKQDASGSRAAAAAEQVLSTPGPGDKLPASMPEPARDGIALPPQKPPRPMRATDWMMAVFVMVLSLAAVYYAVKTNGHNQSQYQHMASSSQAALSAAEESVRSDQRAWVGLSLPKAYPLSKEGGGFAIKLQNFGKTPARNVLITDYVVIEDLDQLSGIQEAASHRPVAAGTLMPGNEFETNVWFKTSPEGVTSLAQGKVRAVNYALITYEDIFHHQHTTQSCFYWHGGLHMPLPCGGFNTVD